MSLEERLERLKYLLDLHQGSFESVRIRCAAGAKDEGSLVPGEISEGWWNLRCDVVAFPRGAETTKTPSRKYPTTLLLEEWCEPAKLLELIVAASNGAATIDGVAVKFGPLYEDSRLFREALPPLLFDCPVYRVAFPFRIQCATDTQPLIAGGEPFYSSGESAVVDWCKTDAFQYGRPYGTVIVRLPQCRARIQNVAVVENDLRVSVRGDRATLANALLKGACWSRVTSRDIECRNLDPAIPALISLPEDVLGLDLHLVDSSGEILDRHVERPDMDPWRDRALPRHAQTSAPGRRRSGQGATPELSGPAVSLLLALAEVQRWLDPEVPAELAQLSEVTELSPGDCWKAVIE